MRLLFVTFILLNNLIGFSQIKPIKQSHNFGDLYENATTYYDFVFTNNTPTKHYLLTVDKPREVNYIYSGKVLLPDSTIILRLKVNDRIKGKFNYSVDVYFSDSNEPITLKLIGNMKEVARNPLTECPDFNKEPPRPQSYDFAITVKVIDSLTREPIRRSKVNFVRNNTVVATYYTNKDGIIHRELPLGYYFVSAEKESYLSNYNEGYLNYQRNYIEIQLQQPKIRVEEEYYVDLEDDIIEINVTPEKTVDEKEIVLLEEKTTEETVLVEEEIVEIVPPFQLDPTPLAELADSIFDEQHFKLNNITFILDVSGSMNATNRLELMKTSMIALVNVLRPNDIISVITYASNVNVVFENKNGNDSTEIIAAVNSLRTSSATAGGDAIEIAYQLNNKIYAADRNNIVIMVTDGAFNKGSKTYMETIAKNYNEKGIIFTVVGIKTTNYLTSYMRDIVETGGGDFIEIHSTADTETKLLKEIKRTSFRDR